MNVWVSLSPFPRAHPPRSNPFLRSSSDAPPFPCITPSMVTWVVVVSFMLVAPLPWRRPLWAASPLPRTPPPRSDTALPDFFEELSRTPVVSDPKADSFAATALHKRAQCGQALGPDRARRS